MKNTTFSKTFVKGNYARWISSIGCLFFLLMGQMGFAQANAFTFTPSAGTYVPITGGTVVTTATAYVPTLDSYASGSLAFPTPVSFNGVTYTNFRVSSNGYMSLGAVATSEYTTRPLTNSTGSNVILSPFGADLSAAAAGVTDIRFEVVGSETVIQWSNFRRYLKAEAFSFQVRIENTTGVVRFVYGGNPPYAASADYMPQVGIKTAVGSYTVLTVPAAGSWATPVVVTTAATDSSIATFNGAVGPANGQTFSFAPPTCLAPSVTTSTVTSSSATINWTANAASPQATFEYYVSATNTAPTQATVPTLTGIAAGSTSTVVPSLSPNTTYYFWIRSNCGGGDISAWSGVTTFKTACAAVIPPTTLETFSTFTGSMPGPDCWSEGTGILGTTPLTLTGTTSGWSNQNYNNATNANGTAVYLNLYGTDNEWFVSPPIDLGTGSIPYQLEFSASVIPYTGTTTVTNMGEKFVKVVVSTDGGNTWSEANVVRTYNNSNIPAGGVNEMIALAGYTGVVKIGFYAFSTTTAQDLRFYIDNFRIAPVPSCFIPTAFQLGTVGETTAAISWTASSSAPANGYQYYVSQVNTAPTASQTPTGSTAAGVVSTTIPNLAPSTTYYVWVRSNCGSNTTSEWVGPLTIKTLCDAPDVLTSNATAVCGEGTSTLTATTTSGANIKWYAAQTGGAPLFSGSTFVTPVLDATTSYFVSASVSGGTGNSGKMMPPATATGSTFTNWGIVFDATESIQLQSVSVFSTTAGTVDIKITNAAGTELYSTGNVAVTAGGTTTPNVIPLSFAVPAGTGYRMLVKAYSGANLVRDSEALAFPYNGSDGKLNVTSSEWGGTTTGTYYYFYNIQYEAECSSPRTQVTVNVTAAPAVVATVSDSSICAGESTVLSATSANADYTYMWMPGGATTATVNINPTSTTTYTVTATDAVLGCVVTETVTVTVNQLPVAAAMSDVTVCEGATQALTYTVPNGTVTSGTGTTSSAASSTSATLGPNPLQNYYGGAKQQWIYTAAELSALGLVAGSEINSIGLNLTAANTTVVLNSVVIKMKNTTQGSFASTTSWITDMTTVKNAFNHTPSVGINTFDLTAPFVWDGTSNSNNNGGVAGTNAAAYSTTSFVSTIFYRADTVTAAAMENFTGTASYTYSQRNNVVFNFGTPTTTVWTPVTNLFTDANATTPYTGQSAATVYTKPTANITYTATITSGAGCSVSDQVMVTVNIIAAPTVAQTTQTFCGNATVANLTATGTAVKWYAAATGGTALASTAVLTDGSMYYASQTVNGCESTARTMVTVEINVTDAPVVSQTTQTFCNTATVADLDATGTGVQWYTAATGGTALTETSVLTSGTTTYYASQTIDGCESATRTAVTAIVNVTTAPQAATAQTFCNTGTVAGLVATGTGIQWYADATGGTALTSTTALVNGTTYYASQTIEGCESATRTAVAVTISTPSAPAVGALIQTFCNSATVADLEATGTGIQWYTASTGGAALAPGTALVDGTLYYASQTIDGCESIARSEVAAEINVTAAPTVTNATQSFCNAGTVADLDATGTDIKWYAAASGGDVLTSSSALVDGTTYFASQTIDGCEGARTAVTAEVTEVAAPTGDAVQVISVTNSSDATIEDIIATGTGIIWYPTMNDAMLGTNAIAAGTVLTSGTTYYATQTVGECSSAQTLAVTVEVVLGVKGFDAASFSYYPNPVKNVLNISYSSDITSVAVFNLLGQQVIAKDVNSTTGTIDMSNLADGAYIVNVTAGSHVKTIKVIKKQ